MFDELSLGVILSDGSFHLCAEAESVAGSEFAADLVSSGEQKVMTRRYVWGEFQPVRENKDLVPNLFLVGS